MSNSSKPAKSTATADIDTLARWEERSASRVLEAGRDQILERSRRIVEAAYELVDEVGLEGLTIRAVLKKSGLSRRAFYGRFEGKDDLVLAVFEQSIRIVASYCDEQVSKLREPLERLEFIVTSIVNGKNTPGAAEADENNQRGVAMSREHLRLAESRPEDLQAALQPLISLIAEQLVNGMAVGVVRNGDPQRLSILVYNLVSTTVHTELLAQNSNQANKQSRTQLAADIWEFCRRAVAV